MRSYIKIILLWLGCLCCCCSFAAMMTDLNVSSGQHTATVTLGFHDTPSYTFFSLSHPDRIVLDIRQSSAVRGLPLTLSGNNLVRRIRQSDPQEQGSLRLVFDLTQPGKAQAATRPASGGYQVILTLSSVPAAKSRAPAAKHMASTAASTSVTTRAGPVIARTPGQPGRDPFNDNQGAVASNGPSRPVPASRVTPASRAVIVAIDAGHGGQDPGAIGRNGVQEKNVTIAIARKLKTLLNDDPMFKGVLTRDGDYFISVMGRSEVARKQNANMLVSIHADAAPNRSASGASVWVLSNRRANSEMAGWLEQHEKQSELLGGAGDLLASNQADPYLSQAVLDLQFGHSQRVGYDAAIKVIQQLHSVGTLHKRSPEHASLGVLRSPDIPSLLVETGFISNVAEERLLGSSAYQDKIAGAIYKGLRSYFLAHPLQLSPKGENHQLHAGDPVKRHVRQVAQEAKIAASSYYVVKRGDTLSGIAREHGVNTSALIQLNSLKNDAVRAEQKLKIPAGKPVVPSATRQEGSGQQTVQYTVIQGDTLTRIATRYGMSVTSIMQVNDMKSSLIMPGQKLVIPAT